MTTTQAIVVALCGMGAVALGCWWMVMKAFRFAVRLGLVSVGALAVMFAAVSGGVDGPASPQAPSPHASHNTGAPKR